MWLVCTKICNNRSSGCWTGSCVLYYFLQWHCGCSFTFRRDIWEWTNLHISLNARSVRESNETQLVQSYLSVSDSLICHCFHTFQRFCWFETFSTLLYCSQVAPCTLVMLVFLVFLLYFWLMHSWWRVDIWQLFGGGRLWLYFCRCCGVKAW